jgi:hypothetical protein
VAGEFDVLAVRLEAHIATFQAQLDRARADLSKFATGAATPAANAMNSITTASTRATPSLNRLNNAFISLGRQITGVPPVIGQFTGVLGPLAIGAGPLALALAGLTALAGGFMLVTKEARAAKKAAEEAIDASNKRWRDIQTQGDAALIDEQGVLRVQLVAQAEKVERAKAAHENKEYLAKLNAELLAIQRAYLQTTTLLTDRRNDRAREQAERTAKAEEKAANDAASAWARAYAQMEEAARERVGFTPDLALPDPLAMKGFAIIFPAAKDADNALAQLRSTVEKLNRELGMVPVGSVTPGQSGGFLGRLGGTIGDMLNPETIISGLATGFISTGINTVVGGITKVIGSLFGLGSAAAEAAQRMQAAVNNIRAEIARMGGDTELANFFDLQSQTQRQLESLGVPTGGLLDTQNINELRAWLQAVADSPVADLAGWNDEVGLVMTWLAGKMKELGQEFSGLTDSMRNIPTGFKIALAQFNATAVSSGVSPLVNRYGVDVRVTFDPAGVFKTVETQAVQVIRSGGRPAWERA